MAFFVSVLQSGTMKSTNIIEISPNDSLQLMVQKLNANFNQLYSALSIDSNIESLRVNDSITRTRENLTREMTDLRDDVEREVATIRGYLIPPVGTFIYSLSNPNDTWPDTSWDRVAEGNFLIASGTTYKDNNTYGSNEVTLTVDQIPSHTHDIDSSQSDSNGTQGVKTVSATSGTIKTKATGGGKAHSNIPMSIAVPLWKRVK